MLLENPTQQHHFFAGHAPAVPPRMFTFIKKLPIQ